MAEINSPFVETGVYLVSAIPRLSGRVNTALFSRVPRSATVVSGHAEHASHHLFLLWAWGRTEVLIIPSGFSSGYPGEGPRGFSLGLCMLRNLEIPTSVIRLTDEQFERIDWGHCPIKDLRMIKYKGVVADVLDCGWILKTHAQLLSARRLHIALYWRDMGEAWTPYADLVGAVCDKAGDRLVIAAGLLRSGATREECQQCGILLRDAWIDCSFHPR